VQFERGVGHFEHKFHGMGGRPATILASEDLEFNEIWHVGTGRRVMHDGMQYDLIQGQG